MSDNIPLEIQSEIIKRLPVKSVVQCRYMSPPDYEVKSVSIVDDDTFPNQISPLTAPQPVSLVAIGPLTTLVSANGLFCFYDSCVDDMDKKIAVLWNPSIAKAVGIPISNPLRFPIGFTYVGFGVCPVTSDPKIVRINTIGSPTVNWEVEVFTLSTRVWKTVSNIPAALRNCDLNYDPVFVDGLIYWAAYDNNESNRSWPDLVISFDLKSDEFGEVCLPDSLAQMNGMNGRLLKIYESLGFFTFDHDGDGESFCDVWIMKEGVTKSFTKMLRIMVDRMVNGVLHFRNNDEVIIETGEFMKWSKLQVYEPSSGRISSAVLNGSFGSFSLKPYMETLLLLDVSNSIIEDDDKV